MRYVPNFAFFILDNFCTHHPIIIKVGNAYLPFIDKIYQLPPHLWVDEIEV